MSYSALISLGAVSLLFAIMLTAPSPTRRVESRNHGDSVGPPKRQRLAPGRVLEAIGHATRGLLATLVTPFSSGAGDRLTLAETPTDRTLGLGILVSALVSLIDVRLLIVALFVVSISRRFGPMLVTRRAEAKKSEAIEQATPVLVDLIRAAVSSGVSPRTVFEVLQSTSTVDALEPFAGSIRSLQQSLQSGIGFVESLEPIKTEGPPVLGLVAALQASELYGVALGPSFDALSLDARLTRRRRVETKARRLPVSLLFPLVVCVLPAFMLLTVVPLLFSGLSSIRW